MKIPVIIGDESTGRNGKFQTVIFLAERTPLVTGDLIYISYIENDG